MFYPKDELWKIFKGYVLYVLVLYYTSWSFSSCTTIIKELSTFVFPMEQLNTCTTVVWPQSTAQGTDLDTKNIFLALCQVINLSRSRTSTYKMKQETHKQWFFTACGIYVLFIVAFSGQGNVRDTQWQYPNEILRITTSCKGLLLKIRTFNRRGASFYYQSTWSLQGSSFSLLNLRQIVT